MIGSIKLWFKASRAPFFQAMVVPSLLGAAIAWYESGRFHLGYFTLALIGAIFINAGTNLANDYFDHKQGADDANEGPTPFSGGSRVIQEGQISARAMFVAALSCFGLGSAIGLYLTYARGWPILVIGLIGVVSGYLYTAAPVKAVYRGWGEVVAGINCGPLVVLGAYYVQVQRLTIQAIVASIPIGLLTAAILYINQFSDYRPDKRAGKDTVVVKLGLRRAVKGYYLLIVGVYGAIVAACVLGIMPWFCLVSLASVPLAWRAAHILTFNFADGKKMIPAMASHIAVHLSVGLLLASSYVATRMLH
jgi:1,4-dihydroxy-2-naphthoate octaprenyltransferase